MKHLIYYPGFEVQDINWLKFALLYIDKLSPIIPESGKHFLTETHRILTEETDLVSIHRPSSEEGYNATLDAIDIIEKVLKNPSRYFHTFYSADITKKWKDTIEHQYTLFNEKYTYDWEAFCLKNNIGTKSQEGLLIPKDVGFIYMTVLSQTIADSKILSPITDNATLDKFSVLSRKTNALFKNSIKVTKSTINFVLPESLETIKLNNIIKLRNKAGFKPRLHAFHNELDKFYENLEEGASTYDFVREYQSVWSDFSDFILQGSANCFEFGLGAWIAVNSPEITNPAFAKAVLAGGASLSIHSIISFRNTWKATQPKRYCRKYLANLKKLNA
jgi:hypothetical protein